MGGSKNFYIQLFIAQKSSTIQGEENKRILILLRHSYKVKNIRRFLKTIVYSVKSVFGMDRTIEGVNMFTFLTKHEIHFKETTTQTHTDRKEEGVDTKKQDDTSSKILCIAREI